MKLSSILLSAGLLAATAAGAQQPSILYSKSFGGTWYDYSSEVTATPGGGMILVGTTLSNDGDISWNYSSAADAFVVKLDSLGAVEWKRVYGGSGFDGGSTISPTSDGGYILGGYTQSNDFDVPATNDPSEGNNIWIVKLDATGAVQWSRTLSGSDDEMLVGLQQLSDGSYILGAASSASNGDFNANYGSDDCWIFKLDSAGTILWSRNYGGSSFDLMTRLIPTSDGGFAFSAFTNSNDYDVSGLHTLFDIWMVKLDNAGTIQWQQCYGGSGIEIDGYKGLLETPAGDFVLASNFGSIDGDGAFTDTTDTGGCWVIKVSSSGTLLWEHQYGGVNASETPRALALDANGNYVILAGSASNDGDVTGHHGTNQAKDLWVFCLDPNGSLLWQCSIGGTDNEDATGLARLSDGNFALLGDTYSNNDGDVSGSGYHWGTETVNPSNAPSFTVNTCDYFLVKIGPAETNTGIQQSPEIAAGLSPNPASEQFTIAAENIRIVEVRDLSGRLVFRDTDVQGNSASIHVSGWNAGTYVVTIETSAGSTSRRLVVTGR